MHRIDTPGNVLGLFSNGNPAIGQRATQVGADWLNDVQENLVDLITYAGIDLEKGDYQQVRDAIVALIAGVVGTGGGSVPTTRLVNGGGLVTGGGALAADLTLTVAKALAAEITAGTLDTKAITPLGLAGALGANLGSKYLALPGGFLVQWGTLLGTVTVEVGQLITLPTSFVDANYSVVAMTINQSGNNLKDTFPQRVSKSSGSFNVFPQYDGDGVTGIDGFEWIAIGRYL